MTVARAVAYDSRMGLEQQPGTDRPRERLYWNGPEALADAELLAIQLGSGMRGDKRRTIRCQDDVVNDHVTGRRWSFRDYARGDL